ncbi:MAG: hypothetical protein A3G52_01630 [Candidatus Taylorbacteria bacterium RIFCSPLOWO2_12_FULL_43_20]|uniref:CoA-binding domain-containing protein n=1 Tax=Candidatus Taylorbacteria bacterium RIFCSPLOWO2_12_FULL_43_20 TaxID=1802332 RepID=A0A1G2P024_9BACT|nr:MAG: hypothetical protein A2825_00140 [Candidatus Taylorbacteria bacterium RIFCSPHIGHO2_01_FULL_43_120]OHA22132.1 MAG: hypothetical protein A3B98_03790 [Candidatus Taylorbacteria bacterium RIFCSPHIGHO2_02_FULL_43_55]OHA30426.1 MAG: hypothetical protein A3E92_04240 [Candidatus Taylorbacteria bacterium RIFCSPHIGHO2_12_FULL_42_34]OHA32383.1 MAG: hypothetical protein A3B09_03790 [Candidatus Taylorbacteria bacterium RIFCSPLOWO2_01_FULL_43_83]OHA37818.1 MAG: hypothetical protein A3H58_02860 [Candi
MGLLLPKNAKLIAQGITGSEGRVALPWMQKYGTKIVAGVTPGKGGQELSGVPVFDTVEKAVEKVGQVDGSVLFVPPMQVKKAVEEAIRAGIRFILIGAEKVPVADASAMYELALKKGANIIGPSSVGLISPSRKIKIGSIGGPNPDQVYKEGEIAVISKSGGMTSEIALHLGQHGFGISWAVGIGGERIICADFADFLLELEKDFTTKASVIFGELGGTYEERVAHLVREKKIKKPVVAFIAGEFTETLPSNIQFGHAGAIIEGRSSRPSAKRKILAQSGITVADDFDEIAELVKKVIV